jgi:hypothetical protein
VILNNKNSPDFEHYGAVMVNRIQQLISPPFFTSFIFAALCK